LSAAGPSAVLLVGFGNPGRVDDGLGPAAAAAIERLGLAGVTVDADYQLTVEDSYAAAAHDVVVFVDAAARGPEPFEFRKLSPAPGASFSSHSIQPEGVLQLSSELFDRRPAAYLLAIRGYEFERLAEGLSPRAASNLDAALGFLAPVLEGRAFEAALAQRPEMEKTTLT
jgi:hydrogenase maturation protease